MWWTLVKASWKPISVFVLIAAVATLGGIAGSRLKQAEWDAAELKRAQIQLGLLGQYNAKLVTAKEIFHENMGTITDLRDSTPTDRLYLPKTETRCGGGLPNFSAK